MASEVLFGQQGYAQLRFGLLGVQGVMGGESEKKEDVVEGGDSDDLAATNIGFAKAFVGDDDL